MPHGSPRSIRLGDEDQVTDGWVTHLQEMLQDEPGTFGRATDLLVRDYQRRTGLTVDGWVGKKTWAALLEPERAPGIRIPNLTGLSPGRARAAVAAACLGIKETSSNRGPEVDIIVREAGGRPEKRPFWCAWAVTWWGLQVELAGIEIVRTKSGRARGHWQLCREPRALLERDQIRTAIEAGVDLTGAVFVRARSSRPYDRATIFAGGAAPGHTGLIEEDGAFINDEDLVALELIAGNSSGAGHSRVEGSGSVARETITEGDKHWDGLVGLVLAEPLPEGVLA